MHKIWAWLKKYWKWFIFPLWIVSMLIVWILRGGKPSIIMPPVNLELDQAMLEKDEAVKEFKAALDDLSRKTEERMKSASEQEVKVFKELKGKSLDEIAEWVDNLK